MRFKDIKIRAKIIGVVGFLALFMVILGIISYIYMGKISESLFSITDHYAKAVEYANGVEKMALATIMEEKNYLLEEKKEAHQRAENNVIELNKFLDKVDKLAEKHNNKELLEQSKIARKAVYEYASKYREGVKSLVENKKAVATMVKNGNIVGEAADTFLAMQADAYYAALKRGATATELNKYVRRYIITTDIYEHALKIMRAEKEEVNYKNRTAYNKMLTLLPELMQLYDKLKEITTNPQALKLIKKARKATIVYKEAAASWINNDNNLKNILAEMKKLGANVLKQAQNAEEASYKQLEQKKAEATKISAQANKIIIAVILVVVILSIAVGIFLALMITNPIKKGVDFAEKVAEGDLSRQLDIDQKDEIGVLAAALNKTVSNLSQMFKDITAGVETLASSSTELSTISQQMSSGSEQTSGKANTVATAAEEMSSNMTSVAAATEEASTNVGMVATAAEEMTAVINEIAQNTEKAQVITGEAVSEAKSASDKVDELGKAAQDIGKVTETITEISEQTNLLALNATIEAARAGEAGKGFAVVANEIKELAKQTSEATSEIKNKITGIQDSTQGTVTQIEQISKVVNDVNEIVSTISTAVEEQSVTTKEIANNVVQASQGISEVTENVAQSSTVAGEIAQDITEVNQSASEMSNSSSQVNMSAEELSKLAEQLKEMVGRFRI